MTAVRCAALLVLLLGVARAAAEPAAAPDMLAARQHFIAATEALKAGAPARAAAEFAAAHRITGDPLLLFNVAEAQRRAGDLGAARTAYRGYLDGVPGAPDRAEVEQAIAAIDAELKARAPAPAARPTSAPAPAAPTVTPAATTPGPAAPEATPNRLRLAAWITASAAVALAATGGLMSLKAKNLDTDLNHRMRAVDPQTGQPLPYASVEPEIRDLRTQRNRFENLAVVFYATAAAAGVAAGTMFYIDFKRRGSERHTRVRLAPHIAAREVGMVAGVEF